MLRNSRTTARRISETYPPLFTKLLVRGLVGVFSELGGEGESRRRPRPGPPLETLRQIHSARRPLGPYGLVSSQLGSMHSSVWKAGTKHFGVISSRRSYEPVHSAVSITFCFRGGYVSRLLSATLHFAPTLRRGRG
jgi:hypothetical protein